MKKFFIRSAVSFTLLVGLVVILAYLTHQPQVVNLRAVSSQHFESIEAVEKWISEEPLRHPKLKSSAQMEIYWADSTKKEKTPYSLVYIHGFSASKDEGAPVHRRIADSLGMNLFLCRLPAHGLNDRDAFTKLEANDMIATAAEAIDIGKLIGNEVVVMGTSTGGTLSLIQASLRNDIAALVLYAPLIDFFDNRMQIFGFPHGLKIAEQVVGGQYVLGQKQTEQESAIWYQDYHIKGLESLAALVQASMTPELFSTISEPLFLGYYYKNEAEQDPTVSVAAMQQMYAKVSTEESQKTNIAYPDAGAHVICSDLKSKSVELIISDTINFLRKILDNDQLSSIVN